MCTGDDLVDASLVQDCVVFPGVARCDFDGEGREKEGGSEGESRWEEGQGEEERGREGRREG